MTKDQPIADATEELRQVRHWLLRPAAETLEACAPALERATARLSELLEFHPGAPDLRLQPAAMALAAQILQAQALLTAAGELYFGRMRRLAESGVQTGASEPTPEPISLTG
jgi:hypothetical protein